MYIVSAIECNCWSFYEDCEVDVCELHYASSYANCINFIKRALADENSGVERDTVIRICECQLDEYFGEFKTQEEKPASEYLEDT
jgi:hypothetical protein